MRAPAHTARDLRDRRCRCSSATGVSLGGGTSLHGEVSDASETLVLVVQLAGVALEDDAEKLRSFHPRVRPPRPVGAGGGGIIARATCNSASETDIMADNHGTIVRRRCCF